MYRIVSRVLLVSLFLLLAVSSFGQRYWCDNYTAVEIQCLQCPEVYNIHAACWNIMAEGFCCHTLQISCGDGCGATIGQFPCALCYRRTSWDYACDEDWCVDTLAPLKRELGSYASEVQIICRGRFVKLIDLNTDASRS